MRPRDTRGGISNLDSSMKQMGRVLIQTSTIITATAPHPPFSASGSSVYHPSGLPLKMKDSSLKRNFYSNIAKPPPLVSQTRPALGNKLILCALLYLFIYLFRL